MGIDNYTRKLLNQLAPNILHIFLETLGVIGLVKTQYFG